MTTLAVETVSGSDLLGAGSMPVVNEHAVSAVGGPADSGSPVDRPPGATSQAPSNVAPMAQPRDANGTAFRPGVHRVKPDGSPFTGRHGQFMPRGGRRSGSLPVNGAVEPIGPDHLATGGSSVPERILRPPAGTPAPGPAPGQPEPGQPSTAVPLEVMPSMNDAAHELGAETALRSFYHVTDTVMASDGEWQPDDLNEHESLKAVLVAWRKATNGKPLPPWLAFLLAALTFIFKRVRRPKTSKRLVSVFPDLAPALGVEIPRPANQSSAAKTAEPVRPPGPVFSTDLGSFGQARPAA